MRVQIPNLRTGCNPSATNPFSPVHENHQTGFLNRDTKGKGFGPCCSASRLLLGCCFPCVLRKQAGSHKDTGLGLVHAHFIIRTLPKPVLPSVPSALSLSFKIILYRLKVSTINHRKKTFFADIKYCIFLILDSLSHFIISIYVVINGLSRHTKLFSYPYNNASCPFNCF